MYVPALHLIWEMLGNNNEKTKGDRKRIIQCLKILTATKKLEKIILYHHHDVIIAVVD